MEYNPGFGIKMKTDGFGLTYGENVFGPEPEIRRLEDIRQSLEHPDCDGPEELYAISMDVGEEKDRAAITERNLLYGAVVYAAGIIGEEPVRSQGHRHAISPSCGCSTPEVYEIWEGKAIIYMQELAGDNPGACYAIHAKPGDVVIVPPGWIHATVNGDVTRPMAFGAWCVRDYGFDYDVVRKHRGIAYYPYVKEGRICWRENPSYQGGRLVEKEAREYPEFGIKPGVPVYKQFEEEPDCFLFVSRPDDYKEKWNNYRP